MKHAYWLWLPVAAIVHPTYAATYFTVEQAQQTLFPGQSFTPAFITLSDDQARAIEDRTGVNVRHKEVQVWKVSGGGMFIVDDVLGKHEYITYAIGLNTDGSLRQIEIMDYKETYGYQVRSPEWRAQFVGKTAAAPLKLDQDIKNIGGATLSCKHIADGVKRILATYEVVAGYHVAQN